MQGFIRFLRLQRRHLVSEAGLSLLNADPHLLGIQARLTWLALSEKEQQCYQSDAESALRAAGLMPESRDQAPAASVTPPRVLLDAPAGCDTPQDNAAPVTPDEVMGVANFCPVTAEVDPYMDVPAGLDAQEHAAPATPDGMLPGQRCQTKARVSKRGQSSQDVAEASPPSQRRRRAKNPPAGTQETTSAASASNGADALSGMSITDLKKKARYLGAQLQSVNSCLEKSDLVEMVRQLLAPKAKASLLPAGRARVPGKARP